MFVKAVRRLRADGHYRPALYEWPTLADGEVSTAECRNQNLHPVPGMHCECGFYSVRSSIKGLLRLRLMNLFPPDEEIAIVAVRPVGRAYDDGLVVRSEKLLVLGTVDWRTLLPPALQRLDDKSLAEFLDLMLPEYWSPYVLSEMRRLLGREPFAPDRLARVERWFYGVYRCE